MTRRIVDGPSAIPALNHPIDRRAALGVLLAPIVAGCTDAFAPQQGSPTLDLSSSEEGVLLVGAGDPHLTPKNYAQRVGRMIKAEMDSNPAAWAFALGDNAGDVGSAVDFQNYDVSAWGSFKARTLPHIGNHERKADPTATAYYDYFGDLAGPRGKGYYAKTLGAWRCYFLNSQTLRNEQTAWLTADLPNWSNYHIMAMWHQPMFASVCAHAGKAMTYPAGLGPWWSLLQNYGAEFVVSGHVHRYERFRRMLRDGTVSDQGIRQFIVGTGGVKPMDMLTVHQYSRRQAVIRGIYKLWLYPDRYEWKFIDVNGVERDTGVQLTRKVFAA